MKRFLWEASYLVTVVLLTAWLVMAYGWWNQKLGALEERSKQRDVIDSLFVVELLQHTDSIVTAIATVQTYRILHRNDSIIRARRVACGPMLTGC